MHGAFVPHASGSAVHRQLRQLDDLLQRQRAEAVQNAEILRVGYRNRASEMLADVCIAKLINFTVNPHRLFKYAVDRGKTRVGKKRDQSLVAMASNLKSNCIVSLV
jgi:hypothetical protein